MAEPTPSERFEELQRQVNQRVQQALSELRQEFGDRLRKAGDQILGELGREIEGVSPELPASFLSADELAPLAAEAGERAQRDAHGLLTSALAAVDRAGSQAEVLRVLARETRRFADRSAVFLTREDGLELWGSAGWGEGDGAVDGIDLPYAERGPWSRSALESGAAELSAGEAANLCERTGHETPAAGVLVPLVLRDRLAAVLYADVEGSGAPQLEALQALTYTAALALETLPFRERAGTPTLHHGGTADTTPIAGIADRPPSIAVEPSEPEDEVLEDVPTAGEPSAPFTGEPEAAAASVDEAEEMEIATEDAEAVEDAGAGAWTLEDEEDEAAEEETFADEGPQAEVGELEISEPEELEIDEDAPAFETDFDDDLEVDLDAGVELEDDFEGGDFDSGLDTEIEIEEPDVEEPEVEEPDVEEPEVEAPAVEEPAAGDGPEEEPAVDAEPDSPMTTAGFEAPSPQPAPGEPPAPPPESAPPAPTAEPSPPSPPEMAPPAGDSQVAPPSDLEGPGRAFGAAEEPASDDEARHEEARRLARLLVSEIRLYNEEEVEEGRRSNDIYQRLKEDIDRSRQMYDERVDPAIRDSTDYFYQELVRNLGGGDAATLGI